MLLCSVFMGMFSQHCLAQDTTGETKSECRIPGLATELGYKGYCKTECICSSREDEILMQGTRLQTTSPSPGVFTSVLMH